MSRRNKRPVPRQDQRELAMKSAIAAAQQLVPGGPMAYTGEPVVGGGTDLLRWWRPGIRSAGADTLRVLPMQRGQSRELCRTEAIAAGAIATNVNRVVGTGLALVAQPDRRVLGWTEEQALKWKQTVQTEFSLFADSTECDWDGEQNFYEKQALTLGSALESGDCFSVLPDGEATSTQPYRLRIQTLEADRIGNPKGSIDTASMAGGVRRPAAGGAPEAFFVYDRHPGSIYTASGDMWAGEWVDRVGRSGRRRILHHFRKLRPEQPRGVPYLAPVVELIKQMSRYKEAEIQAAVVSAFFTVFIETEAGGTAAPIFGVTDTQAKAANDEIALGAGAVLGLAKGEKATFANPTRPSSAFQPFVLAVIQQIGVGLNIPYELLIKQFNASYSASKAALLDAWMWFRVLRTWLARSFCQPVYETWMAEAVANGRISAPGFFADPLMRWAYTRALWHGDSQGSINPKDEVDAYTAAIEARLTTRERAEWELFGTDWYSTYDQKKTEQAKLKADDMLPAPKAGAAAAPKPAAEPTPQPDPSQAAIATALTAIAARETPAPSVSVTVQPPTIEIHQGDMTVNLPESQIQLEAHIETPDVVVHQGNVQVDVPAPQVTVQQLQAPSTATRQTITRDAEGEITQLITEPLVAPTLN
jgi:lambda family phage portal protein